MVLLAFQEVRLMPDGTLLVHVALILLMIFILNRTFFRPVNRVLEQRASSKGGRSSEAQEILKQVNDKQSVYNATMLKARSQGYELIEQERAKAIATRQEKVDAVKEEVAQMLAQQTGELNRQSVEAKTAIAQQAEQLAEKISSNILKTT